MLLHLLVKAYLVKTHVELMKEDVEGRLLIEDATREALLVYENTKLAKDEKRPSIDGAGTSVGFTGSDN